MAIINLTPDSFYDGGRDATVDSAVAHARRAVAEGAAILDLGGESSRPGAAPVAEDEQIARVVPVVRAIRAGDRPLSEVPISIDTTRAGVAAAALDAGADAVNDVSAGLDDPGMLPLAARRGAGVVLMHRLRRPAEDSYSDKYARAPEYADVVGSVRAFLAERLAAARGAGIDGACVALDPGLGFGKTVEQNLALVARTGELLSLGRPLVSGASRKSFVGRVSLGRESEPGERLAGSLAVSVAHYLAGARIFRVHDVAAQAGALRAAAAVAAQT